MKKLDNSLPWVKWLEEAPDNGLNESYQSDATRDIYNKINEIIDFIQQSIQEPESNGEGKTIMDRVYEAGNNNSNSSWVGHSQGWYYHFVEGAEWVIENILPEATKEHASEIEVYKTHIADQDQIIYDQEKQINTLNARIEEMELKLNACESK